MSEVNCALSGESIVCFAGEDWWYHHPHSKNHILKRLAKSNKVLFISSIGMGLPKASNPDFLLKIGRKLKSYRRWLKKAPEGLHVLTPFSLPFYESLFARRLNRFVLGLQIRIAMLVCKIKNPIVWVAIPFAADFLKDMHPKLVLYQVSDKYDANQDSAVSQAVIREFDQRMKDKASVVLYSGRRLYDEAVDPHRYFLEQAVDFEHFSRRAASAAPEIAGIPSPVLAYIGWIDYLIDVELVERVSLKRPDWHWVFIGRRSNHVQISRPNVHFLGPKPYEDLPKYLRCVDVCVVPWKTESVFASYGSAIKVREYLATGKPVVMPPLYEYSQTPGIRWYRDSDEFIIAVEDALKNDTPAMQNARQSAVQGSTWDVRAQQLAEKVSSLLAHESNGNAEVR